MSKSKIFNNFLLAFFIGFLIALFSVLFVHHEASERWPSFCDPPDECYVIVKYYGFPFSFSERSQYESSISGYNREIDAPNFAYSWGVWTALVFIGTSIVRAKNRA